jgi:hypothetical protein
MDEPIPGTIRHLLFWSTDFEVLEELGIDPDMTVTELKRRLRIAERVLNIAEAQPGLFGWLTREDDQ